MNPVKALLRLLIRGYQLFISPVLPGACRFYPTCSQYALEAVSSHGALRGLGLALWRILRCHPWGGSEFDPVPPPACSHHSSADGRAHPPRSVS